MSRLRTGGREARRPWWCSSPPVPPTAPRTPPPRTAHGSSASYLHIPTQPQNSSQILRCDYCRSELYGVTVVPRLCRHMASAEKLLSRVIMRTATQKNSWGNKCERTKLQVFIRSLQCFKFPIPRRDFQCPMHRGCPR